MSVPFSITHLRVPPGFGAVLEGLAREVLRDQPEDIPTYAAHYFDALLKQREESGIDPAEWAANLEERFHNNHAFKATEAGPVKEPAAEATLSKEKSSESQTEDESSHSAEASNLSITRPKVSEDVDSTESTEDENQEASHIITEKHMASIDKALLEEESVNGLPAPDVRPDELSGTEEEKDATITATDKGDRAANEKDSGSVPDQDIPPSEIEPSDSLSFTGISYVNVCAQELETAEDEGGDKQEAAAVDNKIVDSEGEEKTEAEAPVEVFPYPGLADVNVCATELGGTERTMEEDEADTLGVEEESSKPEETQASLSQSETPDGNREEAEDQAEKIQVEEGTETGTTSGEMHESFAHIEGGLDRSAALKQDSLVEISFEDVLEAQQIVEKQPEEGHSVEILPNEILEMRQEDESKEVSTMATDQNISGAQDHDEPAVVGSEKEVNSEGEEMESRHEASEITKEKVDTSHSNLKESDDVYETGEGVKNITSSLQPTTETNTEGPEDEIEDSEKEANDFKEDETTDSVGGGKEDVHTKGYLEVDQEMNDGGEENLSAQVTQSNTSTAGMEAESETLEASAQHSPEEDEPEDEPEDTVAEKELTSKDRTSEAEEPIEEGTVEPEIQEKSGAVCEEGSISPEPSADQPTADHRGGARPPGPEGDTAGPEGSGGDKQEECSRPQEEEDIMDIPLDDPEANRAAAKIQAGFRGHMTRKKMKPEDKAEGEEVSSTGDVLNGSQGDAETGGSGAVESDDTSVPEQ